MIKFIHAADLHLDSPFAMEDASKAAQRRSELRATFARLIDEAKRFEADFVLIAGDLFDRRYVTKNTLDLVVSLFDSFPKCRFIITPGNHDFYSPDSVWEKTDFPSNVFIFKSEKLEKLTFENVGKDGDTVNIFGYSFTSQSFEYSPLSGEDGICDGRENEINILCAHADIYSRTSGYCPITVEQIGRSGFDYVALGHVHNGGEILLENKTYYGYAGSFEAQSFQDLGEHGAFFARLGKQNGKAVFESEFASMSRRIYVIKKVNVTGATDMGEICEKVSAAASDFSCDERTLLRVVLEGDISPSLSVSDEAIKNLFPSLFSVEVKDETLPLFDCDYLANDMTIKGAFFRELLPKLRSEDAHERAIASKALRYGLAALSGGEVIDFV